MPDDLSRPERLQIMLNPEELTAIDDWRFKKRMPSRAAAVRELLRRGLAAEGFAVAEQGKRSSSFGVLTGASESGNKRRGGRSGGPSTRASGSSPRSGHVGGASRASR